LTREHINKFFISKKKIFSKKKPYSHPLGHPNHPHGAKGVAKTTHNGGFGVVSATPLAPWGWFGPSLGAQDSIFIFSNFFNNQTENIYLST
jgi:hypothetical protein